MLHLFFVQKASDENDDEDGGPSWETRESMVRKLQKKFPDQDKEVKEDFLHPLFILPVIHQNLSNGHFPVIILKCFRLKFNLCATGAPNGAAGT